MRNEVLERAHELAQRHIREQRLASLPLHHQIIYEIIRDAGEIKAQAFHDRYDTMSDDVYQGGSENADCKGESAAEAP